MAQKRPRADDSPQTLTPENHQQRKLSRQRKNQPTNSQPQHEDNSFSAKALWVWARKLLPSGIPQPETAPPFENGPRYTIATATTTNGSDRDQMLTEPKGELRTVAELGNDLDPVTTPKENGRSATSTNGSSSQQDGVDVEKQWEGPKREIPYEISEQDVGEASSSSTNFEPHQDKAHNYTLNMAASTPNASSFSTPRESDIPFSLANASRMSMSSSNTIPNGGLSYTSDSAGINRSSPWSRRRDSVSTVNSVQSGRVRKKRPIDALRKSQESKRILDDLVKTYIPSFEDAAEKDLVNYARRAFQASQSVERRRFVPSQTRPMSQEIIEIEDDDSMDRSQLLRKSLLYRTPLKTSPIGSPSGSLISEDRSTFVDGLWESNYRRPLEPKPAETTSEEALWLKQLRTTYELAINPPGKAETPKYDSLKQKTESITQEIEARRKPKSDNFPILSSEARTMVANTFLRKKSEPISEFQTATVRLEDIKTLKDGQWLNDEVINYYMILINERSKSQEGKYPKVHCFNTFFYSNLRDYGFQKVKRWTKKIDLFSKSYVIVPVHLGMHWCCAVINFVKHRVEYYDSLHGANPDCHKILRAYIQQESLDKKKEPYDLSDWEDYEPKTCPNQENGYDCGVFASTVAEYISREEPFDFGQKHMKYIRERMIYEIITSRLMDRALT
ncbi:hypothetical protein BC936DRAFT_148315 [Jimgerdemannia flammicorona]|uniref:Ubiquitin-like protease family profile domain-containing protein n=1 Tax=Jimgerdemannia flammicorona TaxID=994334 RepID=A0A433D3A8_9FUNG|nr:hypothetical protein BC936DRAFT_148315 [Jimgerdemannia flammicorona]